ncbi:MAG TPA: alpha/beta fold hydrolase [Streptosporangiaceae bacterium]|jgi:hypothetical protein
MAELFVLMHSPVVGPATWAPVAEELTRRGHQVSVPALAGFTTGGPPFTPRLLRRAHAQIEQARTKAERLVLVVHSGAGAFAPYLAAGLAGAEVTVIFADAALPPEDGQGRVIDEAFLPFVRDLADGGLVPSWPQWWPAAELAPLFPDLATRERVSREAAPLPLAFFEEMLPPLPEEWRSCRCAFLRFSEGYQQPARQAAARGWPVRELPGDHLHMLVAPAAVAEAITSLAGTLQAR